jgi:hypothetical protein
MCPEKISLADAAILPSEMVTCKKQLAEQEKQGGMSIRKCRHYEQIEANSEIQRKLVSTPRHRRCSRTYVDCQF